VEGAEHGEASIRSAASKLIEENCTLTGNFLTDKFFGLWDLQKKV
jgi:hypothetical protein